MKSFLDKIGCWIFGHQYQVVQEFSGHSRRVVCPACHGDWGMNDDVCAFIPWDEELADLYRTLGYVIYNPWPHSVASGKEGK